jgi:Skp family chaperone for outer membrane proteins
VLKLLRVAALLSVALPSSVAAQTQLPTGSASLPLAYFSAQRAFAQSADGKTAQAKLSSLQAERSTEIAARNAKLKGLQDALQQSATVLAATALRQRELEVERFKVDVQRFIEDAQAEFLGVQRDLENAFLAKVRPALDSVARDKGLLLVINEDAGLFAWADPRLDITSEVVKRVNQP